MECLLRGGWWGTDPTFLGWHVEILSGLEPGQTYIATGGFHLKAELAKEAFADDGHGH